MGIEGQDDCKVLCIPLMVSLSNHRWLERASFDKLRMSKHQWAALLCNRPGLRDFQPSRCCMIEEDHH